jgi:hypothetical protein
MEIRKVSKDDEVLDENIRAQKFYKIHGFQPKATLLSSLLKVKN